MDTLYASIPSAESIDTKWQAFPQLLNGFDAAPSLLKSQLRQVVATKQDATQQNLHSLQTFIDRLYDLKKKLLRNAAGYDWILSPFRTFPTEILEEIFKFACAVDCFEGRIQLGSTVEMLPLRLAHVCSRWRDVAFSLPQLWSDIHWDVSDPHNLTEASHQSRVELLRLALSKSGTRLLDLDWYIDQTSPFLFKSLSECFHHSYRWNDLSIAVPKLSHLNSLLASNVSLPNLQFLTIFVSSMGGDDDGDEDEDFPTVFQSTPKLVWLRLRDVFPTERFPWSQLRSLVLQSTTDNLYLHPLLRQCDQLRTLDIESRQLLAGATTTDSIRLPHLRTLFVKFVEDVPADSHILRYLILPELEILVLARKCPKDSGLAISGVRDMILRSTCTMIQLKLTNILVELDGWSSLFSVVPSLRSFTLGYTGDGTDHTDIIFPSLEQLFQRLNSAVSPVLLPRLGSLDLSVDCELDDETFPFDMIAAAIISRAPQGRENTCLVDNLTSVGFGVKSYDTFDAHADRIQEVEDAGVEVDAYITEEDSES